MLAPRAHPGSIDQQKFIGTAFIENVHRIAGRARQFADDCPGVAENSVDERRLAGIWTPDNGKGKGAFDFRLLIWKARTCLLRQLRYGDWRLREQTIDRFEQISQAAAMSGADGENVLETERSETASSASCFS